MYIFCLPDFQGHGADAVLQIVRHIDAAGKSHNCHVVTPGMHFPHGLQMAKRRGSGQRDGAGGSPPGPRPGRRVDPLIESHHQFSGMPRRIRLRPVPLLHYRCLRVAIRGISEKISAIAKAKPEETINVV